MPLYKQDPNNTKKQIPNVSPGGTARYSHATCPNKETVTKRPSHVNVNQAGTYAFLYETTASTGANVSNTELSNFVTGSQVVANHGNIKLEINPVAWRRTDDTDAVGQITFVYVRVS
tara:strand:- start:18 stop:368 length:351 start_codon:yes stop_codon:yes gene_type:complete